MKTSHPVLTLSLLFFFAFTAPAKAQPEPTAIQRSGTAVATVESIDHHTRQVLLSNAAGDLITIVAGPDVRNLDKVEAGDHIVLTYSQAVAVRLTPPNQPLPGPAAAALAIRAAKGQLPAGAAYSVLDVHVHISSIDKKTNTVGFIRADGTSGTIQVQNPAMRTFVHGLHPGDTVELQYLQAVTIALRKS